MSPSTGYRSDKMTENKIIIAIDGFSSSGKSTFARAIANKLGYVFIDTGAMYRAVTLYTLEHGAIVNGVPNKKKIIEMLDRIDLKFQFDPSTGNQLYINGEPVGDRIRSIEVSDAVSAVSRIPEVRRKLVAMQQQIGKDKGVVMDGRDIGTVVFPDAELKIFLTADPAVRAQRRYDEQRSKGENVSLAEIENNIRLRDKLDQERKTSPLRKADDALILDNSYMTTDQQMEWVMEKLKSIGQ